MNTTRDYQALMRSRLIESRLTPNAISLTGFGLCVVAAVLVWQDYYLLGGIAFIVGSICDTLDGRYSRMSGKGTPFGAFLDSTLDRIEEGVVLTAVAFQFSDSGDNLAVAAVVIAVLASLMVSYTRARAEALGVECKVGIADRAVRVVILSAGLVLAKGAGVIDVELLVDLRCTCLRAFRSSPWCTVSAIQLPVAAEPVKLTRSTCGCSTRAAPASAPRPCTTLRTPSGRPDLVADAREQLRRERRLLGRLQDSTVAAEDRRKHLPGDVGQRSVERDQQAGDADGLRTAITVRCGMLAVVVRP